jgi:hypothetical protein
MKITTGGFDIFFHTLCCSIFILLLVDHFAAFLRIYNCEGRQLITYSCRIVIEVSKFLHICRILGI